ncbi:MAG: sensor histidine kinase [Proteobacteria bacterium]|nr:sensor histidine kinase [Pseudomonadota bacterium]
MENSGPGLSKKQRKFVTERFYRVIQPSGEGSGLGLSIVSHIEALHKEKLDFAKCENEIGCRVELIFANKS